MTFAKLAADDIVDSAEAKNHRLRHLLETAGVIAGTGLAGYGLYRGAQNGWAAPATPPPPPPASAPGHPVANALNAATNGAKAVGTGVMDVAKNPVIDAAGGFVAGAVMPGAPIGQTVDSVLRRANTAGSQISDNFKDTLPEGQGPRVKNLLVDATKPIKPGASVDIKSAPLLPQIVAAHTGKAPVPLRSGVSALNPFGQYQAYRGMRNTTGALNWLANQPKGGRTTLPDGRIINHDDLRAGLAAETVGSGKPGEAAVGMEPGAMSSFLGAQRGAAKIPGLARVGTGLLGAGAAYWAPRLSQLLGQSQQPPQVQ